MKLPLLILLTVAWFASWTGIMLGLSGAMSPASVAPDRAMIAAGR